MHEGLAPEDSFRINVLLTQDLKAVRLDESSMSLSALTAQGEASMPLHPNCRPEQYLRRVREVLAGHALGSPAGYPVHLSRWTRHGQMDSGNLGRLLLTGEPEAVVAVVHSPALTDEIAGHAWWAMPTIEHASLMLSRRAVAEGAMGPKLAEFLIEHLPFLQDDHIAIMDTIMVLLYSGTLTPAQRETIWRRGKARNTYYVTFLQMCPDDLPSPLPAHAALETAQARLGAMAAHNPIAKLLLRAFSSPGQTYLRAAREVLARPEAQEVVNNVFRALGEYFAAARAGAEEREGWRAEVREAYPEGGDAVEAILALAEVDDTISREVFARTTAIGSLMRRKLEPVVEPIARHLGCLQGENAAP